MSDEQLTCPGCGALNDGDATFCTLCFGPLAPGGVAPAPGRPTVAPADVDPLPPEYPVVVAPAPSASPAPDPDAMLAQLEREERDWTHDISEGRSYGRWRRDNPREHPGFFLISMLPKNVQWVATTILSLVVVIGLVWYPNYRRAPYRHIEVPVPRQAQEFAERGEGRTMTLAFYVAASDADIVAFYQRTLGGDEWQRLGWTGSVQEVEPDLGVTGLFAVYLQPDAFERYARLGRYSTPGMPKRERIQIDYSPPKNPGPTLQQRYGLDAWQRVANGETGVLEVTVSGDLHRSVGVAR